MKFNSKIFFVLLSLFTTFFSFSQEPSIKNIEAIFYQYINAEFSNDLESQFLFLYEEQFDDFPKNAYKEIFDSVKENEAFKNRNPKIYKISKIIENDGIQYVKISFNFNMIIDLKDIEENETKIFIKNAEDELGKDKVIFDKKNLKATLKQSDILFAVLNPKYKEWKIALPMLVGDGSITDKKFEAIPSKILKKLYED
jgi:hypothetical protein